MMSPLVATDAVKSWLPSTRAVTFKSVVFDTIFDFNATFPDFVGLLLGRPNHIAYGHGECERLM